MNQISQTVNVRSDRITEQQRAYRMARFHELEYLNEMLPEMRKMALGLEQKTLAYLLELAMMEAEMQIELNSLEIE